MGTHTSWIKRANKRGYRSVKSEESKGRCDVSKLNLEKIKFAAVMKVLAKHHREASREVGQIPKARNLILRVSISKSERFFLLEIPPPSPISKRMM